MNRLSNLIRPTLLISATSVVALIAASPVAAMGAPIRTTDNASSSAFCTGLPTKASNITNNINNLKSKAQAALTNQDTRLSTLATNVDQKVAGNRQTADTNWQTAFSKLEAKATTDSEKAGVQAYETSVNQAIATRRAAYDAARTTFRNNVKNAIDARRSTLGDQANSFASSANNALSSAEAACSGDSGSAAAIRTTLIDSLRTARQTFDGERKDDAKVGQTVQQFAATRDAAFKAADQAFKDSLLQADIVLKQAFGAQASTIE